MKFLVKERFLPSGYQHTLFGLLAYYVLQVLPVEVKDSSVEEYTEKLPKLSLRVEVYETEEALTNIELVFQQSFNMRWSVLDCGMWKHTRLRCKLRKRLKISMSLVTHLLILVCCHLVGI